MSPVHKKKRKKRNKNGLSNLLNTKSRWLVLGIALTCIILVVVISVYGSGRFKDISYISYTPMGEVAGQGSGHGSGADINIPPHPNRIDLPDEYKLPVAPTLTPEQKSAMIEKKYTYILTNMDDYYQWELRRLFNAGKSDYRAMMKGQTDITLSQLINQYTRAGRSLEKEADQKANAILNQMEAELKSNKLALDPVKKAKKEYEARKAQMRKNLLGALGGISHD